ncbi:MAG: transposase [Desulfatibacillum sp.]|nr:transposase [Desulfatibacillum sp.]
MIRIRDNKQLSLFDPWGYLGPKRRALLDASWAGLFKTHCLPMLPVDILAACYHKTHGCPTKELYTALGCVILQQIHDLTDLETVQALAFDVQWHYALDLPGESDTDKYLCERSLRNTRRRAMDNKLDETLFSQITRALVKAFDVDVQKQRLDSVHIQSNMRRLGRLRILSQCIHAFLKNLKRQRPELFTALEKDLPELVERYFAQKALSCFSMIKPSDSQRKLGETAQDLVALVERFGGDTEVGSLKSYAALCRVMGEQLDASGPVKVKPPKEVPSDSLQNPSDPEAGYSGHKGQGYQAQVMETYSDKELEEGEIKPLRLATHVAVESAHVHDSHALVPAIESAREKGLGPESVSADTPYGCDENVRKAADLGVTLIAPASPGLGEKKGRLGLADFTIREKRVAACPRGYAPVDTKNGKNGLRARFDATLCAGCPAREQCPAKPGKRWHTLSYDAKAIRLAKRRIFEKTEEFRDQYRWRAGVEAMFSELDRRTGAKHLRVRGLGAVRFCVVLKVLGMNIFRAARYRKARNGGKTAPGGPDSYFWRLFWVVKERIVSRRAKIFPGRMKNWIGIRISPIEPPWSTHFAT